MTNQPQLRSLKKITALSLILVCYGLAIFACAKSDGALVPSANNDKANPRLVVTYPALGSLVRELVGQAFQVVVPMPNGLDPHEWEPSARDVATINSAAMIIQNGLGLEGGMERTLANAKSLGIPLFTAADHVTIRHVKPGEGLPNGDPDQQVGAADPHIWLDPVAMKAFVAALAQELNAKFGSQVDPAPIISKIDALNGEIAGQFANLPPERRLLITGHESLGYFANRYQLTLVGAIIPSLTTQAEVSAKDLTELRQVIAGRKISVVFTELGTPAKLSQALAAEAGIKVVSISTHILPADNSWFSLMRNLGATVYDSLKP